MSTPNLYRRHRFSPDVIVHAARLYGSDDGLGSPS